MGMKAAEKIIEGLSQLLEGYAELEGQIRDDFIESAEGASAAKRAKVESDIDGAIVTEVKSAIESVMDNEDYQSASVAAVIAALTSALEEIDPEVFETIESGIGVDEEDDDMDDDDDYDGDDEDSEEEESEDDDEEEERPASRKKRS